MRKFACLLLCLMLLLGLALMNGPAATAFDFLKSVENAAKSVEKKLDETFDKKKPGSDESHEEKIDQQKVANEAPKPAERKKPAQGESVVDSVKEQSADMYKTVKGVFVSEDKKTPDAAKVQDAAQAPERAVRQVDQAGATVQNAAKSPKRTVRQVNQTADTLKRGPSGLSAPTVGISPGSGAMAPGASGTGGLPGGESTGGSAGSAQSSVSSEGSWSSCKNKHDVTVSRPGVGMAPSKESYCMARLDVAARNLSGIGGDIVLRVQEPFSERNVESFNLRANVGSQSFKVRSGTFLLKLHNVKTNEIKNLGVMEIKPDSRHSIGADFGSARVNLYLKTAAGKKALGLVEVVDAATGKWVAGTASGPPHMIFIYPGKFIFKVTSKHETNKQFNIELDLKQGQTVDLDVVLTTGETPPKVGSSQIKKWREIEWLVPAGGKATKAVPEKAVKEQVGKVVLTADVNRTMPPRLKVRFKAPDSGKIVEEFEQFAETHPKGKYVKAGKYRLEVEGIDCGRKLDLGVVEIKPGKLFKRDLGLKYTDVLVEVKNGKEQKSQVWLSFKDPATGKVVRKDSGYPKFTTYVYPAKYSMEIRRSPKDATPLAVVAVDARKGGKVEAKADLSNVKAASGGAKTKPIQVKAVANPCGNLQKGRSGCLRLTVKDTDGKPLQYVLDYKSLSGGSGGSYREPMKKFALTPGKTHFVLKCQGDKKVFVVDAKADQLVEREFVFPAVYKGKVNVAGSTSDGGFCVIYFYLYDPDTKKETYRWSIKGRTESDYGEPVITGKYRLVAKHLDTKQEKDLGIIEVKKGQTVKKSVVFQRGNLSLSIYGENGKIISAVATIFDAKTNKQIRQDHNGRDPLLIQMAPGDYVAKVSKYIGNENVPVKFTIKDKDTTVKEVTIK